MNLHTRDAKVYPIASLCNLLGLSKQAYYKFDPSAILKKSAQETFALEYIHSVRSKSPGIGGMKLWYMYKRTFKDSAPLGRDRFESLIDRYGLKVRNKIRKSRTTDSTHGLPVYPDLAKALIPNIKNMLWVADITYIPIWIDECTYSFCYASFIMDAYSKELIGYKIGPTLAACYSVEALEMALLHLADQSPESINLIHHSDRGSQYASIDYVKLLHTRGIKVSMTTSGDPKENAQAERINNTVKNELLKDIKFTSIKEVVSALDKAILFYNQERPHMSIDMKTPVQASICEGKIAKRWTSYRENAINAKSDACKIPENSLPLPSLQVFPSGLRPPVNTCKG